MLSALLVTMLDLIVMRLTLRHRGRAGGELGHVLVRHARAEVAGVTLCDLRLEGRELGLRLAALLRVRVLDALDLLEPLLGAAAMLMHGLLLAVDLQGTPPLSVCVVCVCVQALHSVQEAGMWNQVNHDRPFVPMQQSLCGARTASERQGNERWKRRSMYLSVHRVSPHRSHVASWAQARTASQQHGDSQKHGESQQHGESEGGSNLLQAGLVLLLLMFNVCERGLHSLYLLRVDVLAQELCVGEFVGRHRHTRGIIPATSPASVAGLTKPCSPRRSAATSMTLLIDVNTPTHGMPWCFFNILRDPSLARFTFHTPSRSDTDNAQTGNHKIRAHAGTH